MSRDPERTPEGAERRKYARVLHTIPIRYQDRAGNTFEAKTINVSPFGMLIDSPAPFHAEAVLKLRVELRQGEPIDVTCVVTRSVPAGARHHASVAFINLTRPAFEHLKQVVDGAPGGRAA